MKKRREYNEEFCTKIEEVHKNEQKEKEMEERKKKGRMARSLHIYED